uniref:DUF2887 domain-containing protein n=1 Tax=Petrachloros mirabilis TaxID=2918835 RepID=UPI003B84B0B0
MGPCLPTNRCNDWQAVIIYPDRTVEQQDIYPHRTFLNGNQVHRVYLEELGEIRSLPLWVALMVLTTMVLTTIDRKQIRRRSPIFIE